MRSFIIFLTLSPKSVCFIPKTHFNFDEPHFQSSIAMRLLDAILDSTALQHFPSSLIRDYYY